MQNLSKQSLKTKLPHHDHADVIFRKIDHVRDNNVNKEFDSLVGEPFFFFFLTSCQPRQLYLGDIQSLVNVYE